LSNQPSTPVTRHLEKLGISYQLYIHNTIPDSLEKAAKERGQRPEQVVRSILFKLSMDQYLMALIAGPSQISWPLLRKNTNRSRLTLADKEEVIRVTGYPLGAVSPFGLSLDLPLVADAHIFQEEVISIGSGVRGLAIIMPAVGLLQAFPEMKVLNLTSS
jgi:Cys-tRNA(Pro)/Cys-tRNA(Cys) deacylase